jgi:hypothetical protein
MTIDQDKLTEFLHKFVGDLGATMAAGNVLVGDRLGFYRVLAEQPMLPHELAERTGTATRYVDEWLRGQAAGGYVEYDPPTRAYSLTPEQAFADRPTGGLRAWRIRARARCAAVGAQGHRGVSHRCGRRLARARRGGVLGL